MALEQKLQLKLSQKLIMTPSLQQAIKLLQMTKLELQEVVTQELLENPLLEESTEEEQKPEEAQEDAAVEAAANGQTEQDSSVTVPSTAAAVDDGSPGEK